jgi:flagellum-specific peptidoglycan hydrolase FlgJ
MKSSSNQKSGSINRQVIAQSEYGNYADFVIAQAKHESANFTSKVYRANNNPFGMKVPSKRGFLGSQGTPAPASEGKNMFYARYESDTVAFKDFLKYLRAVRFPVDLDTVEDYALALKGKGYYGDTVSNYTKALKKWLKS